jgi:hypothetical protein
MSKEGPMTTWQQCRAIAAAAMQPEDHEQTAQRTRAKLLAQIAAGSEKGAKLAARLANADGPIQVSDDELPDELRKMFTQAEADRR